MRILFCSHSMHPIVSTELQRYEVLRGLGHDVVPFLFHTYHMVSLADRLMMRLGVGGFPENNLRLYMGRPRRAVTGVVGEAGDGATQALVAGPAEGDPALLAGGAGDGRDPRLRRRADRGG